MPSLIAFVCFIILKMYLVKTCLCLFLFCLGGSTNVLCMHLQSFYTGCSVGKESACNVGDPSSIPGWGRSLEKKIATHSSIFAWKIPWTEDPGGLQSVGSQRVRHNFAAKSPILLSTSDSLPVFWIVLPLIFSGIFIHWSIFPAHLFL